MTQTESSRKFDYPKYLKVLPQKMYVAGREWWFTGTSSNNRYIRVYSVEKLEKFEILVF
jgi:hypothetical protein